MYLQVRNYHSFRPNNHGTWGLIPTPIPRCRNKVFHLSFFSRALALESTWFLRKKVKTLAKAEHFRGKIRLLYFALHSVATFGMFITHKAMLDIPVKDLKSV